LFSRLSVCQELQLGLIFLGPKFLESRPGSLSSTSATVGATFPDSDPDVSAAEIFYDSECSSSSPKSPEVLPETSDEDDQECNAATRPCLQGKKERPSQRRGARRAPLSFLGRNVCQAAHARLLGVGSSTIESLRRHERCLTNKQRVLTSDGLVDRKHTRIHNVRT
jgi:hypothetical protein